MQSITPVAQANSSSFLSSIASPFKSIFNIFSRARPLILDLSLNASSEETAQEYNRLCQATDNASPHLFRVALENRVHNRYGDVLPNEPTRFKLQNDPAFYYNANWVLDGKAIAAQGPLKTAIPQFWKMVWESDIPTIAMLANPIEEGRDKCAIYWPSSSLFFTNATQYGDILVTPVSEKSVFENGNEKIVKREFKIKKGAEEKTITQYHLQNWPDHGTVSPQTLAKLIQLVGDSKVIAHCSAGIGRTGTFLAALSASVPKKSIYQTALALRDPQKGRVGCIQTKEQYHLVFQTVNAVRNACIEELKVDQQKGRAYWVYSHPVAIKMVKIAALVLGIGSMVLLPLGTLTKSIASLAIAYGLYTGYNYTASLDLLAPPHHDMKHHAYKEAACEGGKLHYEGDVPILSLTTNDPFQAGHAHGYLCGDAINQLFNKINLAISHTKRARGDQLPQTIATLRQKIPASYLREIDGVIDGYKKWAKESWMKRPTTFTADDLLLLHLIPDACHFSAEYHEKMVAACTAVVDKDPEKGFQFVRNMDWTSFGVAGTLSLIIKREGNVEVGMPGLVGTFTGMNSQGLAVAMNVAAGSTDTIQGLPAAFYTREALKQKSVKDLIKHTGSNSPLGPYHLTAVDVDEAASVHFFQSPKGKHVVRKWQKDKPLITLNCRYNPEPNTDMHASEQREILIEDFLARRQNRPLEELLALPIVNNAITTHRVVMEPKTRTLRVAFDNAYAGNAPLHTVTA